MKKLVLVLAIVFAGFMTANAQVWIGGSLGAQVEKGHMGFDVNPEIGYTINDQFQVAVGVEYSFDQRELAGDKYTDNSLALRPYFRYVGGTIGHKFFLFADLCGDFGLLDRKGTYAVTIQPGIAWQPCDNKKFTAAFRFATIGYDHNFHGTDGFLLKGALGTSYIGIYYTL